VACCARRERYLNANTVAAGGHRRGTDLFRWGAHAGVACCARRERYLNANTVAAGGHRRGIGLFPWGAHAGVACCARRERYLYTNTVAAGGHRRGIGLFRAPAGYPTELIPALEPARALSPPRNPQQKSMTNLWQSRLGRYNWRLPKRVCNLSI
jgi:hypothetical protein